MKGDFVIVRALDNVPLVRQVWESDRNVVQISAPEQFMLLSEGKDGLMPVGFKRKNVFRYSLLAELSLETGDIDWDRLEPYDG
jgi:hypothetical protein